LGREVNLNKQESPAQGKILEWCKVEQTDTVDEISGNSNHIPGQESETGFPLAILATDPRGRKNRDPAEPVPFNYTSSERWVQPCFREPLEPLQINDETE